MSPLNCSFSFFLARLIAVASTVYTCLVCNSSIVATCPSIPTAHFTFRLFYSFFCFLFVVVVSGEPKQKQGRGLVDHKPVPPPPSNFIADRPKAALLFWFFGDFRCGALLFMVIHVIFKYKIGKNSC